MWNTSIPINEVINIWGKYFFLAIFNVDEMSQEVIVLNEMKTGYPW
jgi:hypothetical protein